MKSFHCTCGQRVFFDNTVCAACRAQLGFDPVSLDMVSMVPNSGGGYVDGNGTVYNYCQNFFEHKVCNWLIPVKQTGPYCPGCERTQTIPSLDVPGNLLLWGRLEAAKRRLLYSLLSLGLPLAAADGKRKLNFQFLEDRRRNPAVAESFISTGHMDGTITINLDEADNVARQEARDEMLELYRTLLGHFRHESGHFYLYALVWGRGGQDTFRQLFGDERADYATSLDTYYRNGPPGQWSVRYISAYASSHPYEDWAETFAHYLHIVDALETAESAGLITLPAGASRDWLGEWMELSINLNEMNRSLGIDDSYPFVLSDTVREKLNFIDRLVRPPIEPDAAGRN